MRKTILLAALLASSPCFSEVTLPHTFTAGTPAVASEVNGNFSAVRDGVNTNETSISSNTSSITDNTSSISSLSSQVGRWITRTRERQIGYMADSRNTFMSKEGYYFYMFSSAGVSDPITLQGVPLAGGVFYISSNCDSDIYINPKPSGLFLNSVFRIGSNDYYVDYENTPTFTGTVYQGTPGSCTETAQNVGVWLAIPNDPSVTGFDPSIVINGPLYLEYGTID